MCGIAEPTNCIATPEKMRQSSECSDLSKLSLWLAISVCLGHFKRKR